jgi:hypothetical protein
LDNSDKILKFGHYYNSGDLLTCLPGFRSMFLKKGIKTKIYQKIGMPVYYFDNAEHPVLNKDGVNTSMNMEMFEMLKPLIEYQSYIEGFEVWEGEEVDFNSLLTRDSRLIPIPNSDLHFWMFFVFPQLSCDLSEAWIELPPNGNVFNDIVISGSIIVNRTQRYTNPYINYFFLKDYQDKIIFAGTEKEHKRFKEDWKLEIPRLIVKDFLELAQAIKCCRFFMGNQSFNFHVADSLKQKRILEVCASFPNTLPTGKNGHAFLHQKSLELYFDEFINES